MLDWPEKPELGLNCKMLGIFCSQKPASPSVSGTLLWQARALLFKSEIWVLDEWTFICSNSHLSWTFLVSLYPQAPKLFYLLKWMTISYSLALKRPTVKCSLAYTHFFHYVSVSHKEAMVSISSSKLLLIKKKKKAKFRWIKIGHEFQLLRLTWKRSLEV